MFPKPKVYPSLLGVFDNFFNFLVAPSRPIALDHVVFEAQLSGRPAEFFCSFNRAFSAVHVLPDRATWFEPGGVDTLREKLRIRRGTEIWDDIRIHQRIEIAANDHDAPGCGDRS